MNPLVEPNTSVPLCIYHGGCDDGFGAAMAVWLALEGNVELYPGAYKKPPPVEEALGRLVYIVDFSYKLGPMQDLLRAAERIVVYDHHKTAENQLRPLFEAGEISGEFDMDRSGAMITWEALHETPPPKLYQYIQDRDLWHRRLPDGDLVTFALRSYPQDVYTWEQLIYHKPINEFIDEGRHIHRYYRTLVDQAKARARQIELPTYGPILAVNCDYFLASEVAGEICDNEYLLGACYYQKKNGSWYFSLRGAGAREVAEFFGGGGHDQAAGFELDEFPEWLK